MKNYHTNFSQEFYQCMNYISFLFKYKNILNNKPSDNNYSNLNNDSYYLISKEWLQKWKHYINFSEINKKMKEKGKHFIDKNDYKWVQPIIDASIQKNKILIPLINRVIYIYEKNHNSNKYSIKIDPMAPFVIINKETFILFINKNDSKENNINIHPSVKAIFLYNKIIIKIDENNYYISFKYELNSYYEMCFNVKNIVSNQNLLNAFLYDIVHNDIKKWIELNGGKLNETSFKIKYYNFFIEIINKTLISFNNKNKNSFRPNLYKEDNKLNEFKKSLKEENITKKVLELYNIYKSKIVNEDKLNNNMNNNINNSMNNNMNNYLNKNTNNNMKNNMNNNMINNMNNNLLMKYSMNNNINNNMNNNMINNMNNNMINNMNNNMINNLNNNMINNLNNNMINNLNNNMINNMNNNMINNLNINNINNNNNFNNNFKNNGNENSFFPHKIGLQNIGQTCYMNATLQCLSNIEELTRFILNYNFMFINPLTKPLSIYYWDLLRNLFFPNKEVQLHKYYAPYNFKDIIGKMNPLFQGFQAADAKDLLFFILETLHDELNLINNFNKNNFNMNINMNDPNIVFQLFTYEFLSKNNSIITYLFYGFNQSYLKCLNCKSIKYSFQSFNITIIPLIKAYYYKLKKYGHDNKILNINDAFESLEQEDFFDGDNMIYCNNCKQLSNAYHKQVIYRTPKILIVVLNRGKGNLDYQGEFEFESELDLSNIIHDKNWVTKYYLFGVISHIGESGSSGHFIAFCRNKPKTLFYCYNDAGVFQLKNNNDNAYGKNQPNNINEKRTPYILFYRANI